MPSLTSPPRRVALRSISLVLITLTHLFFGSTASAQPFPNKPITVVVGYPPGGSNDIVARIVAPVLSKELNTTVVVENRAGAGGTIGVNHVAKSQPDGYTLLLSSASPVVLSPQTLTSTPFDPLKDLAPVNTVGQTPEAIATGPALKVKTLKELLERASNEEVTLSSSGSGGLPHLTIELLRHTSNSKLLHVPYKGAGPAVTDTLAGHVDAIVMDLPPLYSLIREGRLNALAVTSADRVNFLPDVPTAGEALPDFNVVNWIGIFAPAGTPTDVMSTLDSAIKKVVENPDVRKQLENNAVVPITREDPTAFKAFFDQEYARWGAVLRQAGVTMN